MQIWRLVMLVYMEGLVLVGIGVSVGSLGGSLSPHGVAAAAGAAALGDTEPLSG